MNVKLTHHAAELLEAARGRRGESADVILEHALESFIREQNLTGPEGATTARHQTAVRDLLDFVKENRVHLGPGLSVKELIREGQHV